MKKILFLTLLSAFTLILAITSCSNNDYEETINAKMSKSRMTRAAYSITMEEVQERLRLIGEKYGTTINLLYLRDLSDITEETFLDIEHRIAARTNGINPTSNERQITQDVYTLIDDSSLNEISIASTNSNMEATHPYTNSECDFSVVYYFDTTKHKNITYDFNLMINCDINYMHSKATAEIEKRTTRANFNVNIDNYPAHCNTFSTTTIQASNNYVYFGFSFIFNIKKNSVGYEHYYIDGTYLNGISLLFTTYDKISVDYK